MHQVKVGWILNGIKCVQAAADSAIIARVMYSNPAIAVLTRTANRPRYFERCHASVVAQGDLCRHYALYDTPADVRYLEGRRLTRIFVDTGRQPPMDPYPASSPPNLRPAPFNRYFNEVYDLVSEPWIYHLDDDDCLLPGAFGNVLPHLSDNVDMVVFRIYFHESRLPPEEDFARKNIRLCGIGTECFLLRSDFIRKNADIRWDSWSCGDFRFISRCAERSANTVWLDTFVARMESTNLGNRKDL